MQHAAEAEREKDIKWNTKRGKKKCERLGMTERSLASEEGQDEGDLRYNVTPQLHRKMLINIKRIRPAGHTVSFH